jgi:hypothetical protein
MFFFFLKNQAENDVMMKIKNPLQGEQSEPAGLIIVWLAGCERRRISSC